MAERLSSQRYSGHNSAKREARSHVPYSTAVIKKILYIFAMPISLCSKHSPVREALTIVGLWLQKKKSMSAALYGHTTIVADRRHTRNTGRM